MGDWLRTPRRSPLQPVGIPPLAAAEHRLHHLWLLRRAVLLGTRHRFEAVDAFVVELLVDELFEGGANGN